MKRRPGVRDSSAEEGAALSPWDHAITLAAEQHDPSMLALHLARGRIPDRLRDKVYRLIIAAPWRDAKPQGGRQRSVNRVDEIGIASLYALHAGGFLLANQRVQSRSQIIDMLCHRFNVSKSTVERVLKFDGGALPKPPRVLKPKRRT